MKTAVFAVFGGIFDPKRFGRREGTSSAPSAISRSGELVRGSFMN